MADIQAQLRLSDAQYQQTLRKAADATKKFRATAESEMGGFGSGLLGRFAGKLAIGAAVGAGVRVVRRQLSSAGDLIDMADRLQASAESVQRLDWFATKGGTDAETVIASLTRFNRALAESGENEGAAKALADLNISAEEFALLEPDIQLRRLSEAFQEAESKGQGFSEIFKLLGKSGAELLPLLRKPREEFEQMSKTPVISEEQLLKMDAADDKLENITQKLSKLTVGAAGETLISDKELAALGEQVQARKEQRDAVRQAAAAEIAAAQATGKVAEKTAEETAAAEQAAAQKRQTLEMLKREIHLRELLAQGRTKEAQKLQEQMQVEEAAQSIAADTGMSLADARGIAQRTADLDQEIADRDSGKIRGYRRKQGAASRFGGLDEFQRLQQRDDLGNRVASPFSMGTDTRFQRRSSFEGLKRYEMLNLGAPGKRHFDSNLNPLTDYGRDYLRSSPMAQRAAEAGQGPAKQPGVESKLDDMIAVLQAGLLSE